LHRVLSWVCQRFLNLASVQSEGIRIGMLICKYCNTRNQDGSLVCFACGASDFKHKCENCGTVFEKSNFCPQCGVKAGARPKVCPRCGTRYYSAACPDCGYIRSQGAVPAAAAYTTPPYYDAPSPPQPARRRLTWLWVLGWIFIFPLPLTVLAVNNRNLNFTAKTIIITASWFLYFVIFARIS
jgi:hypothetical protein